MRHVMITAVVLTVAMTVVLVYMRYGRCSPERKVDEEPVKTLQDIVDESTSYLHYLKLLDASLLPEDARVRHVRHWMRAKGIECD